MATVVIRIAGTDYTADILFATARFESAVNGAVGTCKFRVRDDTRTLSFVTGDIIELLIDGSPVWTGYLQSQSRVYAFPAENVTDAGLTRWLDLVGADINILFSKRFVFNQSTPANLFIPPSAPYPAYTADNAVIADLVTNFLDLSGDGLDVSTYVENVADINADQPARPASGGYTWGQAMASIAMLPGAVYFIDPARNLVYTDVNTVSAPFGLSDQPDGVTTVGYREMTLTADGTSLANDVLGWGMGLGSSSPVFDRDTDATSLATHGRWQAGTVNGGVYKQATIERVVDSIVYGSPSNQRGAKDDRTAVVLTTYVPGFLPAQKVDFTSAVFGFSDVIPIRRMVVTFDAPDTPKYELTISHAIDSPWGFFDQYLPKFPPFPPLPPIHFWWPPLPCGGGNMIASFANWSVGAPWTNSSANVNATAAFSTTGLVGESMSTVSTNGTAQSGPSGSLTLDYEQPFLSGELEVLVEFEIIGTGLPNVLNALRPNLALTYGGTPVGSIPILLRLRSGGVGQPTVQLSGNGTSGSLTLPNTPATPAMTDTQTWVLKIGVSRSANTLTGKAWLLGQTEPGWQVSIALSTVQPANMGVAVQLQLGAEQAWNSGVAGQTSTVGWTNLFYNCTLATPPIAAPPSCGMPGDEITELPQWLGGGVVKTRCSYQPGSLKVDRNGLRQRGEGIDYTQTDSTAGLVTFSDPLSVTDTVQITYISQGNPSS